VVGDTAEGFVLGIGGQQGGHGHNFFGG
jgi:hypothetical protein